MNSNLVKYYELDKFVGKKNEKKLKNENRLFINFKLDTVSLRF